jgi:hypothetical protein
MLFNKSKRDQGVKQDVQRLWLGATGLAQRNPVAWPNS